MQRNPATLVLSTMHTIDASETVGRMVEFFPGIKQLVVRSVLAGVLRGVVTNGFCPRSTGVAWRPWR